MKARDVMTRTVISVNVGTSVLQAAQLMLQNKISGLPVLDVEGRLVGIVTEGDFLRRGEIGTQRRRPRWLEFLLGPGRLATEYVHTSGRKVEEIMTPAPYTISGDTPLQEIVRLMEKKRVKRLPVVDNGKMTGIVSRANLMYALANLASEAKAPVGDDAAICQKILAECKSQTWGSGINVAVRNGVVDIWGAILDEQVRPAIIVAAENVSGVKVVHDHMIWIDPMSGLTLQSNEDEAAEKHRKPGP